MAFKMKGSSLYGRVNLNRGGNANRPDGRAKSSAFQDTKTGQPQYVPGEKQAARAESRKPSLNTAWVEQDVHNDKHTSKGGWSDGARWDKDHNPITNEKKEKRDKEGAPMKTSPMTDKPKHQKGGSYTYKGKTYAEFSKLPDEAKQMIYAKNAPNQELAKKVYGIKDENRDEEVAGKPGAPMKTSPMQKDKKVYAMDDYDAGTSKIIAAAKGGASKEEIRAMVQAHNKSTMGKKYKKGSMSNSQIGMKKMWSYMPKETVVKEEPAETALPTPTAETAEGVATPSTQPDVTSELAKGLSKSGAPMKKSPMEKGKTSTWSKVKAAGKAFVAGAKETHGGAKTAMDIYTMEKRKYREAAEKNKKKK